MNPEAQPGIMHVTADELPGESALQFWLTCCWYASMEKPKQNSHESVQRAVTGED